MSNELPNVPSVEDILAAEKEDQAAAAGAAEAEKPKAKGQKAKEKAAAKAPEPKAPEPPTRARYQNEVHIMWRPPGSMHGHHLPAGTEGYWTDEEKQSIIDQGGKVRSL